MVCRDAFKSMLTKTTFTATGVLCSSGIVALSEPTPGVRMNACLDRWTQKNQESRALQRVTLRVALRVKHDRGISHAKSQALQRHHPITTTNQALSSFAKSATATAEKSSRQWRITIESIMSHATPRPVCAHASWHLRSLRHTFLRRRTCPRAYGSKHDPTA